MHSCTIAVAKQLNLGSYFKAAHVVNLKLIFTNWFFYNLVIVIKVCNILECPWSVLLESPWSAPWGAIRVFKCPLSAPWVPVYCFSSKKALQHYWKWSKDFKKLFRINVLHKLIVFCFLRNKMCKFYHVLLARYNDSMGFQKLFLNIL